jgi:Fibrobacter succinogenes major domain (Fib_succ_major).
MTLAGAVLLLTLVACNRNEKPEPQPVDFSQYKLRVEPVLTRATETNFESGDAIGLSVAKPSGDYAANVKLTYDGTAFSGDLNWYEEGEVASTLKAYYPYQEGEALPTSFTVQHDQSKGTAASDFVSAVKENVLPSANAVPVVFKHQLSRLVTTVKNNTGADIESIVFEEFVPQAHIAADLTAKVVDGAKWQPLTPFFKDDKYYLIVPAQTVKPVVKVTAGGKTLTQDLAEVSLEPGKQYTVSMIVNKEEIKIVLAGEIENWNDGGEIVGGPSFSENLEDGYFTYDGVKYNVAKMKDGKWWMAQNLAYLPEGYTPATDITAVTAGVFAPLQVKADHSGLEFSTDPAVVAKNGYLYQAEVALGLKVGDLTSVADAQKLEAAQGICPKGWHVPTLQDILSLVGKSVGATTDASAPYYDGANGAIALLNADGFNMAPVGMVSIQDNTKTSGLLQGFNSNYPDRITSSMFCGSTYAGVTYNTSGDEASGVKNLQFYGLMPMTNKATEAEYTCNGTKVSYRIAGPVRCVRNVN